MKERITRRTFLAQSASVGLAAALAPAEGPVRRLIPYVNPPERIRPGTWAYFATTCRECPAGCGMYLRHRDGRVIKAEGNPEHPLSRGGLCARGQSCVQGLYDPDRLGQPYSRDPAGRAVPSTWEEALPAVTRLLKKAEGRVAILSRLQTGALAEIIQAFGQAFGSDRMLWYEPITYEAQKRAHALLFGRAEIPAYPMDEADFVLSLGADFLDTWLSPVQFANRFGDLHAYREGKLGRLVYVGPVMSVTAGNADEFVQVEPGQEWQVGVALLNVLLERGGVRQAVGEVAAAVDRLGWRGIAAPAGVSAERVQTWAQLVHASDKCLAFGGAACTDEPSAVKAAMAAALLNVVTGQLGPAFDFSRTWTIGRAADRSMVSPFLQSLSNEDLLIVIDANPAYGLTEAEEGLKRGAKLVYVGTHMDETATLADWVLPADSFLESWSDYEPLTDLHGLVQPTLRRLHETRSIGDTLLDLARAAGRPLKRSQEGEFPDTYAWLRARWSGLLDGPFEEAWTEALKRGGFWASAGTSTEPVCLQTEFNAEELRANQPEPPADDALRLWLHPSVMLYDGRVANRGWLQEAPDPVSTLVWGSCVDMHPDTARRLGLKDGLGVQVSNGKNAVQAPVRVSEDIAPNTVSLQFGQGHVALGRYAKGIGANAFLLLQDEYTGGPFGTVSVSPVREVPEPVYLSATQQQHGRHILQWVDLSKVDGMESGEEESRFVLPLPEGYDPKHDMYPAHEHKNHRWAMVIDLQRCTGCGACAVACYAENNVPVMGRKAVSEGREMAWLKVVPYRHPVDPQRVGWLPLLCQHCDAAPCEPVCPVFAAVHSEEGLNEQVYNRCIGTRYCSNNCPYKVRRFNWFNVEWPAPLDLQLNPEVSVRCRGVMEKCTFCVQRIRNAEWIARGEGRPLRDGEIQPACVQSCPSGAFVFGDLMDPNSRVSRGTRNDPRRYHVLGELNTKPAITYLRRIAGPAWSEADA